MTNKRVTLSVDSKIYDEFKEYCKKKGLVISRQFEIFVEEKLKKNKRGEE